VTAPDPLNAAIDRLYATFAHVPKPTTIEGCSHCWYPSEDEALLAPVPLRDLPADTLRPYLASVLSTIGSEADFRYFLPRLLEIACTTGFNFPELDHVISRMAIAGCADWVPEERQAIRALEDLLWTRTLATYPSDVSADDLLFAIGMVERDLGPFLDEWAASLRQAAAVAHLDELYRYAPSLLVTVLASPTVYLVTEPMEQILRWSIGADVRQAVADAVDFADSEEALQVLAGIDHYLDEFDKASAR
jgi:hypothetical protein